jgi:alginate O-acetyltransferase complex protein AlgI
VGISYLTFKIIHYGIEVYRDKIQHHSCIQFLVYLLFFPIFTAGPIERFDHFLDCRDKKLKSIHIVEGCTRIIYGIIKKFFIAENLIMPFLSYNGITTKHLLENLNTLPPAILWIHVFLWYLYFYMDFSAYSDIAIGGSRLFGFTIQENFNHPLLARNIGEFWQRWHMTLANWCQNYIYLPLIGKTRNPHITVFTTMVIIGLWHEGNFHWALWGLYHATGIVIFRFWQKKKRAITILNRTSVFTDSFGRIVTMLFVSASYCFLITKPFGISAGLKLFLGLLGIKYL